MKVDKMDRAYDTEGGDCLLLNGHRELLTRGKMARV